MLQNCHYRVSAKALITDSHGRILFVEENDNQGFELPGGGIEHGETPKLALAREIKEELNANLVTMNAAPSYVWIINSEVIWLIYEATIDTIDTFKSSEHAAAAGFYTPAELYERSEHGLGYCTRLNYEDLRTFVSS